MIIHFIAAESNIVADIEVLRKIVRAIHEQQCSLARDWVEPAYARRVHNAAFHRSSWTSVYRESVDAIAKADIVIAEASNESFSVGYQVDFAIREKKPVLLLHKSSANKDMFVSGVAGVSVVHKEYKKSSELETIIKDFIQENRIENKDMRFNFFIDRPIYNYLRWASHKTGKTKSEILRELVQREITNRDDY